MKRPLCRCPIGGCLLHPSKTTCGMRDGPSQDAIALARVLPFHPFTVQQMIEFLGDADKARIVLEAFATAGVYPSVDVLKQLVEVKLHPPANQLLQPGPEDQPVCQGMGGPKATAPACCDRVGEYNGYGSGPVLFVCPKSCPCHD